MKYFLILLISGWIPLLFAQSDVFETDGKGNRDIERTHRISSSPKIIDSIKTSAVPNRALLGPKLNVKILVDTIQAATIETEQLLEKYYPFYLKVGMGSTLMPLGEFYVNSTRSRSNYYGLHVKHLSFLGDIKNRDKQLMAPAGFDKTSVQGNFETFQKKVSIKGKLNYTNHGFHYYGLAQPEIDKDSIAQRYQLVNALAEINSLRGDTGVFNIKTSLNFRYTGTDSPFIDSLSNWKAKEQGFSVKGIGTYRTGNAMFYGDLGLRYNGYTYGIQDSVLYLSDSGIVRKNTIIDLNPGVKSHLLQDQLIIDAGFKVSVDAAEQTRAYFFPAVYMQYALLNDQLIPYINITGQVKQGSLTSFYQENNFVLPNMNIQNEVNPYDIQLGIKGRSKNAIRYGLMANFVKENNRAFFVNDTLISTGNKFTLVYDSLNHTKIEGRFGYEANKKLSIDLIARYHSYEMFNEAKAWNLPTAEVLLNLSYNLFDKFLVKAGLDMSFGRYAKVYQAGEQVSKINNQFAYNMGNIIDGNLGLEYRYNKRISGFVQLNNIASQRYLKFYNYPVMPISVFGGLTIKF
ncbi:MAG: hypothetical protein ACKO4Y_02460 [Flavobacteriales bacterium]